MLGFLPDERLYIDEMLLNNPSKTIMLYISDKQDKVNIYQVLMKYGVVSPLLPGTWRLLMLHAETDELLQLAWRELTQRTSET